MRKLPVHTLIPVLGWAHGFHGQEYGRHTSSKEQRKKRKKKRKAAEKSRRRNRKK